ncbi:MAG TPA: RagB/SusD family nutrient uptake outer membrane protein [Balneolaceae bacterium]|nr:RagB/SusD family nutrient uptake outer membrane protein [Balneolaceae bacterium]
MYSFTRRLLRFFLALTLVMSLASCGNNFLSTQPQDTVSANNFFKTNKQVENSTDILYGSPWFQFNDKFSWAVGDIMSGNGRSWSGDVTNYGSFSLTDRGQGGSTNTVLTHGWQSLWTVVAQANSLINNLPNRVGSGVSKATLDHALGEAHVMRALAYFYLVRLWGPIPIIKNNLKHVYDTQVPRYKVSDIYKFIVSDLTYGINNCKKEASGLYNGGHVTSGSAKSLLSKVYLTMGDYKKAQQLSQQVIDSGEFHLLPSYANLFKTSYNNNIETIIALQWAGTSYGNGNSNEAYFAYNSTITGLGTGWAELGPTISLQNAYKKGDKREKPTIMLPGAHYSEILKSKGGYTVPNNVSAQGTDAATKKYVVGTPADNNGQGTSMSRNNNTYMLRYADVLLVNSEAAFRNGDQAQALKSINKVRERAGLSDLQSVTLDDILHCRRLEFADESKYWYTLARINRQKAINMISNQERGTYANAPKQQPPTIYSEKYTPSSSKFLLPYPEEDVTKDPYFSKAPQSYSK